MGYLAQTYITTAITDAMYDILWRDLHVNVSNDDPCQLDTMKVGYRQEGPKGIVLLVYENDPVNPSASPHKLDPYPAGYPGFEGEAVAHRGMRGRYLIGGTGQSFEYQRWMVLEFQVWMQKLGLEISRTEKRGYLEEITGVVRGRAAQSLMAGGPTIGMGMLIKDSFGEYVVDGPFLGDEWLVRQVGESGTTTAYMRVWYRTTRETNT